MKIIKLMMLYLTGLISLISNNVWAEQMPLPQQILKWVSNLDDSDANPKEDIKVDHTEEIRLHSGEKAYLSGVIFNNSGRNFWGGYILTRPKVKEAQILAFGGQANTFEIHTLYLPDKDYSISLIELKNAGSGQGMQGYSKNLTYINGWKVNTLHEVEASSYDGYFNDKGEIDCASGWYSEAYLQIVSNYILETTVDADGCTPKKIKDYKLSTRLIPIQIP